MTTVLIGAVVVINGCGEERRVQLAERASGSTLVYMKDASGDPRLEAPGGARTTQVMIRSDGTVQVTATDGSVYGFRVDGTLDTITDPSDQGKPTVPTTTGTPMTSVGGVVPDYRLTAQPDWKCRQ